jgi:type II secretory pathway pseudopilin PulG
MKIFINKKRKFNLSAFTLFELLITITIMMVITTIFVINYKTNSNSFNRKQGISEFIALANEATSRVLGSYGDNATGNYNGWGIAVISTTDYALFRCHYSSSAASNTCRFDYDNIEIIKTLPEGLTFQQVAAGFIWFESSNVFRFTYWPEEYFLKTFNDGNYASYGYVYPSSKETVGGSGDLYMGLLFPTYSKYEEGESGNYVRTAMAHADFFIEDAIHNTVYQVRMHRGGLIEELPEAEDPVGEEEEEPIQEE